MFNHTVHLWVSHESQNEQPIIFLKNTNWLHFVNETDLFSEHRNPNIK
jgi:hypothetical protein